MECSLLFKIGSKVTIENYNTFFHHYGSRGYKFRFQLNSNDKTGEVFIIDMASAIHEKIISRLQEFFKVPNNGVVDDPFMDSLGNPHARIMCEVAVRQNIGELKQKCSRSLMREPYVRAVVSIKILEPRQGMPKQRWDFGNVRKNTKDPILNMNDPALCNAPNDPRFQIIIPINDVFWDPPFPVSINYIPVIPINVAGNVFSIDLYRIQRVALKSRI
ncbi:hypothetical protein RclHR1_01650016 [Rhizophagus clarus]|uniref:Uncharacterized protein n=1 Tax=Rhizophagus clarus TaxID=94130 RepID=A0A2Z6QV38_9GLOM|nr:hypothetical protein RclHR1_01650016 [Rhizophagus clarus]